MSSGEYIEWHDGLSLMARQYADRIVFVRASDYQKLLKVPGAERVPAGVAFEADTPDKVQVVLDAAASVRRVQP